MIRGLFAMAKWTIEEKLENGSTDVRQYDNSTELIKKERERGLRISSNKSLSRVMSHTYKPNSKRDKEWQKYTISCTFKNGKVKSNRATKESSTE